MVFFAWSFFLSLLPMGVELLMCSGL